MRDRVRPGRSDESASAAVPAARKEQLIETAVGGELVVYDQRRHHIHHLNRSATAIWRLCDGRRSVSEIAIVTQPAVSSAAGETAVRIALSDLETADLLSQPLDPTVRLPVRSRRSLLKRLTAATLLPVIISMTAAQAADAQSVDPPPACRTSGQWCDPATTPCCLGLVCNQKTPSNPYCMG